MERIDDRPYIDVARYITKEAAEDKPVGAQMWTPSRNLEKQFVRILTNWSRKAAPMNP